MLLLFLGVIVLSASSSSDAFGLTCAGKFGQLLPASTLDVLVASWRNLARATQPLPGKDGQFYYLISFCAVGPDDGSNTATFSKMGSDQMTIELHAPPSAFVCSYIASGACGFTAMRLPPAPAGYYIAQYASILSWVQVNTLIWTTDSLTRYGVPSYTIDTAVAMAPQTYLRACTNPLPFNSIYGSGTTTPGVCMVVPCALGLRATAPARTSGFLSWSSGQNDASLLPSCAACPETPFPRAPALPHRASAGPEGVAQADGVEPGHAAQPAVGPDRVGTAGAAPPPPPPRAARGRSCA